MKHPVTLFAFAAWLSAPAMAQQSTEAEAIHQQINDIMLDEGYQSQEDQDTDRHLAGENAVRALMDDVNARRAKQGLDSLPLSQLRPFVQILSYRWQTSYCSCAYVKIADIDRLRSGIAFGQAPADGDRRAEPAPAAQPPVAGTSAVSPAPSVAPMPPSASTPRQGEAATSPRHPTSQQVGPSPAAGDAKPSPAPPVAPASAKSQVLMALTTMTVANEVYGALKDFLSQSDISAFGKLARDTQPGDGDYMVVFDRERVVRSILQPSGDGSYINLLTRREDSLGNYRGTGGGALWFRF